MAAAGASAVCELPAECAGGEVSAACPAAGTASEVPAGCAAAGAGAGSGGELPAAGAGVCAVAEVPAGAAGAAAGKYDAIILAVAHNQFKDLNYKALLAPNGIIYDVKGFLPRELVDARL